MVEAGGVELNIKVALIKKYFNNTLTLLPPKIPRFPAKTLPVEED
jgi:hypothetical protein